MIRLQGTRVFGGFAFGTVCVLKKRRSQVTPVSVDDVAAEKERFLKARLGAQQDLKELYEMTLQCTDDEYARIFDVQQMMLDDPEYEQSVYHLIESEQFCAEYAVSETGRRLAARFEETDNAYMQLRAEDLRDVSERVVAHLTGEHISVIPDTFGSDTIVVTEDLTPGEIVRLDHAKVVALVTRYGSVNSHAAILARSLSIPSVTAVDFNDSIDGKAAILDSYGSLLIVDPDEQTAETYRDKQRQETVRRDELKSLKGKDNITADGRRIDLFANIGSAADVEDALENDAGGIGLFRSELLFLGADSLPSEEAQFAEYRDVAAKMNGKKVIIRTLDAGADKHIDYLHLPPEENPALGLRAIRYCLDRKDILRTQLRAILRASHYGQVSVMYPMIASVWELQELKELFEDVKSDLREEGVFFDPDVRQGIMIETPAAVFISEQLAQEADFFSIGTNDLTQYILAADRQNPRLERYSDPHHPAVLRAIRMTVENAHRYGKRVGICGELAADTLMTEFFLALGIDELSMSPPHILAVRDAVRKTDLRS